MVERRLAEAAMDGRWNEDLERLEARQWPPVARRIEQARLRTGLSLAEVALRLGLTLEGYWDLERRDDEAFVCISLRNLASLGRILSMQPRVLLLGDEAGGLKQSITEVEISSRLAEKMSASGQSIDQFGDAIGWDIKDLLADPTTLWNFTVEGLYDLCKPIAIDWVTALPESGLAS